eukprot:747196-Hanusia_phi.AAC.3
MSLRAGAAATHTPADLMQQEEKFRSCAARWLRDHHLDPGSPTPNLIGIITILTHYLVQTIMVEHCLRITFIPVNTTSRSVQAT